MNKIRYISGLLLLTFAISLIVKSEIGASPWDAANVGLSLITPLTLGAWTILSGAILVIAVAALTKTKPVYLSILIGVLTGILIDFWSYILELINFEANFFFGIAGIVIFAFGISLYTKTDYPPNPIDNFMMCLMKHYQISYGKAKLITDFIGLTVAIIVGGPIGIGTAIIYFMIPILLQLFDRII